MVCKNDDSLTLASALFQASGWLSMNYAEGTMERTIADICWQAFETIEELEGRLAIHSTNSGDQDQVAKLFLDQKSKLQRRQ
jgi:hypothetical protein